MSKSTAAVVALAVVCAVLVAACVTVGVLYAKTLRHGQPTPTPLPSQSVVTTIPHFLSNDEADHIIQLAQTRFEPSLTVDARSGVRTPSRDRTSSYAFIQHGETGVIRAVEARAAAAAGLPV